MRRIYSFSKYISPAFLVEWLHKLQVSGGNAVLHDRQDAIYFEFEVEEEELGGAFTRAAGTSFTSVDEVPPETEIV